MGFPEISFCGPFSFFCQAEDGIRDHCVTGVQTCALPISVAHRPNPPNPLMEGPRGSSGWAKRPAGSACQVSTSASGTGSPAPSVTRPVSRTAPLVPSATTSGPSGQHNPTPKNGPIVWDGVTGSVTGHPPHPPTASPPDPPARYPTDTQGPTRAWSGPYPAGTPAAPGPPPAPTPRSGQRRTTDPRENTSG